MNELLSVFSIQFLNSILLSLLPSHCQTLVPVLRQWELWTLHCLVFKYHIYCTHTTYSPHLLVVFCVVVPLPHGASCPPLSPSAHPSVHQLQWYSLWCGNPPAALCIIVFHEPCLQFTLWWLWPSLPLPVHSSNICGNWPVCLHITVSSILQYSQVSVSGPNNLLCLTYLPTFNLPCFLSPKMLSSSSVVYSPHEYYGSKNCKSVYIYMKKK